MHLSCLSHMRIHHLIQSVPSSMECDQLGGSNLCD